MYNMELKARDRSCVLLHQLDIGLIGVIKEISKVPISFKGQKFTSIHYVF